MKHTIKVTQEHIDKGRPRTADCCMVALAMREAVQRPVEVRAHWGSLGGYSVYAIIDRWGYRLPRHVSDAIDKFDDGQNVEPFEFEIELEDAE